MFFLIFFLKIKIKILVLIFFFYFVSLALLIFFLFNFAPLKSEMLATPLLASNGFKNVTFSTQKEDGGFELETFVS
jgi:hypothetical protein